MVLRALRRTAQTCLQAGFAGTIRYEAGYSINQSSRLYSKDRASANEDLSSTPRRQLPASIKKLNRLLGRQQLGSIPEHELKETFVRGSGPGGQAINKTSSSVSLIHLPTGLRVQAQPTRSREANRKAARRILAEKLDLLTARETPAEPIVEMDKKETEISLAGSWSRTEIIWEKERRRKANRAKKAKRKHASTLE